MAILSTIMANGFGNDRVLIIILEHSLNQRSDFVVLDLTIGEIKKHVKSTHAFSLVMSVELD